MENKENRYQIEAGKVLIVLSDQEKCCFHSMYCVLENGTEPVRYMANKHLGMSKDSFVIISDGYEVSIGYYPGYDKLDFYRIRTQGLPVYIENAGKQAIICASRERTIEVAPGERKCFTEEDREPGKG